MNIYSKFSTAETSEAVAAYPLMPVTWHAKIGHLETANKIKIWCSVALNVSLSAKLHNISKVHMSNLITPQFVSQAE